MDLRYVLSVEPDNGLCLEGKNYKGQPRGCEGSLTVESFKEKLGLTSESSLGMASGTIRTKAPSGNCPGS